MRESEAESIMFSQLFLGRMVARGRSREEALRDGYEIAHIWGLDTAAYCAVSEICADSWSEPETPITVAM